MSIDLLRPFVPSSLSIEGYSTIHFLVLRDAEAKAQNGKIPAIRLVSAALTEMLKLGYIVAFDRRSLAYWVFSSDEFATVPDQLTDTIKQFTDYSNGLYCGKAFARDLVANFRSGLLHSNVTLKAIQVPASLLPDQGDHTESSNESPKPNGSTSVSTGVLQLFTSAVANLISYTWVRDFGVVPCAKDRYILPYKVPLSHLGFNYKEKDQYLASLKVHLLPSGTITLSWTFCSEDEPLVRAAPISVLGHGKAGEVSLPYRYGEAVTISLSGRKARLLNPNDPVGCFESLGCPVSLMTFNIHSSRKSRFGFRTIVVSWLKAHGLQPPDVYDEGAWVCIMLEAPPRKADPAQAAFGIVDWPIDLCWKDRQDVDCNIFTNHYEFGHNGFDDPFDFLNDTWNFDPKLIDQFSQSRQADGEGAHGGQLNFDYDFESLITDIANAPMTQGMSQAATGPYPTPPAAMNAANLTESNFQTPFGGSQQITDTLTQQSPSIIASESALPDPDAIMTDDLFGDADISMFDEYSINKDGADIIEEPQSLDGLGLAAAVEGSSIIDKAEEFSPGTSATSPTAKPEKACPSQDDLRISKDLEPQISRSVHFSEDTRTGNLSSTLVKRRNEKLPELSLAIPQDAKYLASGKFGQITTPTINSATAQIKNDDPHSQNPSALRRFSLGRSNTDPLHKMAASATSVAGPGEWDSSGSDSSSDDMSEGEKKAPASRTKAARRASRSPESVDLKRLRPQHDLLEQSNGLNTTLVVSPKKNTPIEDYLPTMDSMAGSIILHFFANTAVRLVPRRSTAIDPILTRMANFCNFIRDPAELTEISLLVAEQGVYDCHQLRAPRVVEEAYSLTYDLNRMACKASTLLGTPLDQDFSAIMDLSVDSDDRPSSSRSQSRPSSSRPASRPGSSGAGSTHVKQIFDIPALSIMTRKDGDGYSMAYPSTMFWNALGLEPMSGPKNVTAYCIYPSELSSDSAVRFMGALSTAYTSSRLGNFSLGVDISPYDSLRSFNFGTKMPVHAVMTAIMTACQDLATTLNKSTNEKLKNSSIYLCIVDPFQHPKATQALCTCFRTFEIALLDKYEAVLQIIPVSIVTSIPRIVVDRSRALANFVRTIYDRCLTPSELARTSDKIALPSVELEDPPPRIIDLQLTEDPPFDLLGENTCLHIAYAISEGNQWLSVAWTDNFGKIQHSSSYSLRKRTFEAVLDEFWAVTLAIMSARKVHWRLFVVRIGHMEDMEMVAWFHQLKKVQDHDYSVALLQVNTTPVLTFIPRHLAAPEDSPPTNPPSTQPFIDSPATAPVIAPTPRPVTYGTPTTTTTPQPAAQGSPAAGTPGYGPGGYTMATPLPDIVGAGAVAAEIDPAARLISVADESWGMLLNHQLNVSAGAASFNYAQASGYLCKRTSAVAIEPPVLLEVNVLLCGDENKPEGPSPNASEATPQYRYQAVLREVIVMYRNLALLARIRGLEDEMRSTTPWHVSVASKAARALGRGMVWP